jgi:hypothetical protein
VVPGTGSKITLVQRQNAEIGQQQGSRSSRLNGCNFSTPETLEDSISPKPATPWREHGLRRSLPAR